MLGGVRAYSAVMAMPVEKLTEEVLALSRDERAVLADRLVESLDPLTDEEVRGAWAAEALRRRDEFRSGAVEAVSLDVARARVQKLFRK